MSTSSIFLDESQPAAEPLAPVKGQGSDTSRALVGLLSLAETAAANMNISHPDDALQHVIGRPTLRMLLSAMRFRDTATMQHCRRVATLAVGLAKNLGWDRPDQKVLEVASLLHDLGKIGIPDNILFKPGRLNAEESKRMLLHSNIGTDILQACGADIRVMEFISQAMTLSENDHEIRSADASEIHLGARILAVADAYDSLRNDQVFREGRPHNEILEILMNQSGTRFDGNVICALSRWIEREGVPEGQGSGGEGSAQMPPADSQDALEANVLIEIFSKLYQLEESFDGFYVLNANREFIVWSRGLERVLDRPARNMLGRRWEPDMFGYAGELGQPLSELEIPIQQAWQNQTTQTGAMRVKQSPEVWLDVEIQTIPLLDEQGRLLGAAELYRDLQQTHNLPDDYKELKLAASRDPLTSVANRGELESQLDLLFDDYNDSKDAEPFCAIFLDIDFFKNINDTFGHTAGDQVLVDIARMMRQESYSGELVGRYGGEEFVILCPATTLDQAVRRAERLRESLENAKIGGISNYRVTASFGVAQVERKDSPQTLLDRADRALYQAKNTGRNKTVALTPEQMTTEKPKEENAEPENPFLIEAAFEACLAADMVIYKIGGLVRDEGAKLGKVTKTSAVLTFGSAGLFRVWGGSPKRQPVKVSLEFVSLDHTRSGRQSAAKKVRLKITVQPVGSIRKADVFRTRAKNVLKLIRAYLQADQAE